MRQSHHRGFAHTKDTSRKNLNVCFVQHV
jgi:hypothetical protein